MFSAFVLGVFIGAMVGWVTCALMVQAGRTSDELDRERRAHYEYDDD
jgi:hypothetical protein